MAKPKNSHQPRKRFGQNFLQDESVIQSIARAIRATAGDHVVEIGPGQGALTEALINSDCRLDAIELDRDLTARLLASFSVYPGFKLHSADALTFDFKQLISGDEKLRVVGNLPYNISTPLLFRLLELTPHITDMHFMLQKEVVDRLAAHPGNKEWGRLGIMAQFDCEVTHLFDVPPEAFYPPPKVQSAIVCLVPRAESPYPHCDKTKLAKVVQLAFSQRRKTLRNNFKRVFTDNELQSVDISPDARAETLGINQFVALSALLSET